MNLVDRVMLWGSALLVGGSGTWLGVMKYLMTTDDPYAVINHPWQPMMLKIHIVSAPLMVFAVGIVFAEHIWKPWRAGLARGRWSGVWTLSTLVPMVFSGYLIQSVTHDSWLNSMIVVHLITGFAYLLGFFGHQIAINVSAWRKQRAQRRIAILAAAATGENSDDSRAA